MKSQNIIVMTTINKPTKATMEYCKKANWTFIIVGDTKTPHDLYRKLEKKYKNVVYLDPDTQEKRYKELSDTIGWKSIQRRNIGFIEAYKIGATVVATVDDDNIPYKNWGEQILIGKEITAACYEPAAKVFDPISITKNNFLWHRGFPIQLLDQRLKVKFVGKKKIKVHVQANLWDGDPDIDAIARLAFKPNVKFNDIKEPYFSKKISPFNSQNTFISREALPYYAVLPHIGRMDDIWGSYILQYFFPNSVIYHRATVYQERNKQDLITNLEKEMLGYRNTINLINDLKNFELYLPDQTKIFWHQYRKYFS